MSSETVSYTEKIQEVIDGSDVALFMPEQPPPTTRIRRLHSGFPSSSRKSSTFLAAISVSVIIRASLKSSVMAR